MLTYEEQQTSPDQEQAILQKEASYKTKVTTTMTAMKIGYREKMKMTLQDLTGLSPVKPSVQVYTITAAL